MELDPELDPNPLVRGTDPQIRIRTKIYVKKRIRIWAAAFFPFFQQLYFLFGVFRLGEAAAGWELRQRPI